ncbi:XrtA system polysaccharide deacetylase [Geotalea sp. SG265]|uniref:XrtA system polysaccharide deacetylase n=1 Tax=Geotalea sp. SG265 TaxID=2922867 RepID=UPI001FAED112|nr:XrtA system polysaccharide deacetylase [Geotalea sp. SG265]
MHNALTIDVEDYFQVTAFSRRVRIREWDSYPLRVRENTWRLLELLDRRSLRATFFVLGWVAERVPGLVRDIQRRGHEIACHGHSHQLVYEIGRERFRQDIRRAKAILEDITGTAVFGYRAPSYSITARSLWALEILVEEGFTFDSSIFPIIHDIYGIPGGNRFIHDIDTKSGRLREFPITTLSLQLGSQKWALPVAGGGYLRLLPAPLVAWAIGQVNRKERQPAVVYFHPWEIDPEQPRIRAGFRSTFRHYLHLEKMEGKIGYLLDKLDFTSMGAVLQQRVTDRGTPANIQAGQVVTP